MTRPPIKERSLAELEEQIASGNEGPSSLRRLKRVRRTKLAAARSAEARSALSQKRSVQIRAEAARLKDIGIRYVVPPIMKSFGVSRSTVMRALRHKDVSVA